MGQKLGHNVFIVIEKESEVQLVIEEAANVGVQPQVGLRVRLSSLASSKWADTGGEKAKFGLSAAQLLSVVERFRQAGLDQGVRLLHFHMGSQIANLADYQHGFKEAIRYYGELRALGLPVDHIDVGGGLGVDYDGTHSRNASSINYDIDDYAGVVVGMLKEFCDAQGLPHPHIFSESGRALTAHHAVLITQVTDVERHNDDVPKIVDLDEQPEIVRWLAELLGPTDAEMVTETYWRATHYIGDAAAQYADGKISLAQKALAEQCYFAICRRLHQPAQGPPALPPAGPRRTQRQARRQVHLQLLGVPEPAGYLGHRPGAADPAAAPPGRGAGSARGTAGPDLRLRRQDHPVRRRAEHRDQPAGARGEGRARDYLIGVFLVGAYQEILGDMHNLFGDTDSVNVYQRADGGIYHAGIETHDTIEDMLRYVHLSPEELMTLYRDKVAGAKLTARERNQYLDALRLGLTRSAYLS